MKKTLRHLPKDNLINSKKGEKVMAKKIKVQKHTPKTSNKYELKANSQCNAVNGDISSFKTKSQIYEYECQYHTHQFHSPKRSTTAFCEFLESKGILSETGSVLDIGAGMGAVTHYMSSRWKDIKFVGLEKDRNLVNRGSRILKGCDSKVELIEGDLYELDGSYNRRFDGIVCVQTLSWLDGYEDFFEKMFVLEPSWMGITSLFYDGLVDCRILLTEYFGQHKDIEREHQYNIYSLELVKNLLVKNGYTDIDWQVFNIDIDLPRPANKLMGTYTEKLVDGRRLQVSGPILMPWYFIYAKKP